MNEVMGISSWSSRTRLRTVVAVVVVLQFVSTLSLIELVEGSWCIAKSGMSAAALQTALDYACGAGADCAPIQPSGLCFLPNTLPAHASYAFNSYYQRSSMAPGSCDFNGAATVSITDPSYGSCTYPSSPSTAGGSTIGKTPGTNTPITTPTFGGVGGGAGGTTPSVGGLTPGLGTPLSADTSTASFHHPKFLIIIFSCLVLKF